MKKLIVFAVLAATITSFAEENSHELTKEERQERTLRMTGGFVIQPGSQRGKVAIVNTQEVVPEAAIQSVAKRLSDDTRLNFEYRKQAPETPEAILKASGAAAAIIVVNDETQPIALVAIEDNWAIVNVAKIGRGLKTDEAKAKFIPSRTAKEVSRCAEKLCSGTPSRYRGNVLDIRRLEDLDLIDDGLPMDRLVSMQDHLKVYGLSQERRVIYRKACQEGWAPVPTNDYQKAIWQQINEKPSEPLKIKFDPAKKR